MRKVADDALVSGESPLDIMLDNMRFYYRRCERLGVRIEGLLKQSTTKAAIEAVRLFKLMGEARMKAQHCAIEAAPFVHPRLSAIAVKTDQPINNYQFVLNIGSSPGRPVNLNGSGQKEIQSSGNRHLIEEIALAAAAEEDDKD